MSTTTQDKAFLNAVINETLLEEAMEWIGKNMSPEDVFRESDLSYWAMEHGFIEDE